MNYRQTTQILNIFIKVKDVERLISLAEIAWKSGNARQAIIWAKAALREPTTAERAVALRIFIARAYAKLGRFAESNTIYRALLTEKNYIPPVIMGLLYNNFNNPVKANGNVKLVKLYV